MVTVEAIDGHVEEIGYDMLVVALGSVSRACCRSRVWPSRASRSRPSARPSTCATTCCPGSTWRRARSTPELRKRLLTFTFVGGGFAGVEALAELEDMARTACKYYENIEPEDMRWVLVEAAGRILPEVRESLGVWTVEQLEKRGIEVFLSTQAKSFEDGHVMLSDGTEFDSDTIVWNAGVKANPIMGSSDLPLDQRGRLICTASMQVEGVPGVWAAGDCAAVPDLSRTEEDPSATCAPNAQHAVRQAKLLAKNIMAVDARRQGRRTTTTRTWARWPASACARASRTSSA